MTNEKYMALLAAIDKFFMRDKILLTFANGLKVRCVSFTGIMENDFEPDEEEYVGEYSVGVVDVEVLMPGRDDSVMIYEDSMEICLKCIPEIVELETGEILWQRDED